MTSSHPNRKYDGFGGRSEHTYRQQNQDNHNGERVILSPRSRRHNEENQAQKNDTEFGLNFHPPQSSRQSMFDKPTANVITQRLKTTKRGKLMAESSLDFHVLNQATVPRKKSRFDQPFHPNEMPKPTKKQEKQASLFLTSKSDLLKKVKELQYDYTKLATETNKQNEEYRLLLNNYSDLEIKYAQADSDAQRYRRNKMDLQDKIEDLKKERDKTSDKLKDSRKDYLSLDKKYQEMKKEYENLKKSSNESNEQNRLESLQNENSELTQKNEAIIKELDESRAVVESMKKQLESRESNANTIQSDSVNLRIQITTLENENKCLKEKFDEATALLQKSKNTNKSLRVEITNLTNKLEEREGQLNAQNSEGSSNIEKRLKTEENPNTSPSDNDEFMKIKKSAWEKTLAVVQALNLRSDRTDEIEKENKLVKEENETLKKKIDEYAEDLTNLERLKRLEKDYISRKLELAQLLEDEKEYRLHLEDQMQILTKMRESAERNCLRCGHASNASSQNAAPSATTTIASTLNASSTSIGIQRPAQSAPLQQPVNQMTPPPRLQPQTTTQPINNGYQQMNMPQLTSSLQMLTQNLPPSSNTYTQMQGQPMSHGVYQQRPMGQIPQQQQHPMGQVPQQSFAPQHQGSYASSYQQNHMQQHGNYATGHQQPSYQPGHQNQWNPSRQQ